MKKLHNLPAQETTRIVLAELEMAKLTAMRAYKTRHAGPEEADVDYLGALQCRGDRIFVFTRLWEEWEVRAVNLKDDEGPKSNQKDEMKILRYERIFHSFLQKNPSIILWRIAEQKGLNAFAQEVKKTFSAVEIDGLPSTFTRLKLTNGRASAILR